MRPMVALGAALALSGCFAVTDLDRFEVDEGAGPTACDLPEPEEPVSCTPGDTTGVRDLTVDLDGFASCTGQRLELRVVDSRFLVIARAVIDGNAATAAFVMPSALPPGEHTMDVLVDGNRNDDDELTEPSWREPICDDGAFSFDADSSVQSIADPDTTDIGRDFVLHLQNMGVHELGNQGLKVAVVEAGSGQTVGYYHLPDIVGPDFDVVIPGIIVSGLSYRVDFFADANQNGVYDGFPTDHSWREMHSGTATGLELTFSHNTDFTSVAESFP